jgi:vancomycin permeability regulator SanA
LGNGLKALSLGGSGFYVSVREILARSKTVIDIIRGIYPKYLGEQIAIQ